MGDSSRKLLEWQLAQTIQSSWPGLERALYELCLGTNRLMGDLSPLAGSEPHDIESRISVESNEETITDGSARSILLQRAEHSVVSGSVLFFSETSAELGPAATLAETNVTRSLRQENHRAHTHTHTHYAVSFRAASARVKT